MSTRSAFGGRSVHAVSGSVPQTPSLYATLDEYQYSVLDKSPHTRRWYAQKLLAFADWCARHEIGSVEEVRTASVQQFLDDVRTREHGGHAVSTYTVHGYGQVVKGFLNWAVREELIPARVTRNLKLPKVEEKIIEVFTVEQIKRLFFATGSERSSSLVYRDRAILAVLLDTGVRASELCTLTLDECHLSPRDSYLLVHGKGRRMREVGLGKEALQHLSRYVTRFRRTNACNLFVTQSGAPLTPHGLEAIIKRLGTRAGVTGVRCSPHTFRHTFAVHYLTQGGDVYVLSRILGHSNVTTTENYLKAVTARQVRTAPRTSILNSL
jgi:site-specific recombinase XerD